MWGIFVVIDPPRRGEENLNSNLSDSRSRPPPFFLFASFILKFFSS